MSPLHYNPTGLDLLQEATPEGSLEWVLQQFGGPENLPEHIVERLRIPEVALAPLLDAMTNGDELWLCQSEKLGPLLGHKGIALVRDGQPIIYMRVINY